MTQFERKRIFPKYLLVEVYVWFNVEGDSGKEMTLLL